MTAAVAHLDRTVCDIVAHGGVRPVEQGRRRQFRDGTIAEVRVLIGGAHIELEAAEVAEVREDLDDARPQAEYLARAI
jgi:hypothetical protein